MTKTTLTHNKDFEASLEEAIQRIVAIADPDKIILFGSAARGELGSSSDLDLLVIKDGVHRRRLAQKIYRNLIGVGCGVDLIVVHNEDIDEYKDCPAMVIGTALREGKVVYASETQAT